jgi:hypothetical protein
MKKIFLIFSLILITRSLFGQQFTDLYGDYLGQTPPGDTPIVFAPGIISTQHHEHSSPTFSTDGNEVFWSIWRRPDIGEPQVIMTMQCENGTWSKPAIAPFSGKYRDGEPIFATDGNRLYFYSTRPTSDGKMNSDIWFVNKQANGWSEPKCLGFVAKFPELKSVYQPSVTGNGSLYFISRQKDVPPGEFLIWRAACINGKYPEIEPVSPVINDVDVYVNWTPFIAPDESYLLFSRGDTNRDIGDLYISFKSKIKNEWTAPVKMGEPINTKAQERFPSISPDGKYLFFCRSGNGGQDDVYWVSTKVIDDIKSEVFNSQNMK